MITVRIQTEPFNLMEEEWLIRRDSQDIGALTLFQGLVRGGDRQTPLTQLYIEHYPGVTEHEILRIVRQAKQRWTIDSCCVIHRVGTLRVAEPIVLIIATAAHRREAFLAAEYIMDYLKTEAPFWKKEFFSDASEQWVTAKATDGEQKAQWQL